jgi:hypothetical protein
MFTIERPSNVTLIADSITRDMTMKPSSPLEKLIHRNIPCINLNNEADITDLFACFYEDTDHEANMEEMSTELSSIIVNRVSFIRNHVVGVIEDIMSKVDGVMADYIPVNSDYTIQPVSVPELLTSELLYNLTHDYKDTQVTGVRIPDGVMPVLNETELFELIKLNDEKYDSMVKEFILSTELSIVDIYNKTFLNKIVSGYPDRFDRVKPYYTEFYRINQIICFFIARGFKNNIQENVNLDLVKYQLLFNQLSNDFGKFVHSTVIHFSKPERELVRYLDGKRIIVNDKLYKDFLKEWDASNLVGAVIGNVKLGDGSSVDIGVMQDSLSVYNRYKLTSIARANSAKRGVAVKEISRCINEFIKEEDIPKESNLSKADIISRVNDVIRDCECYNDMDRLYYMVRDIVCKGLYPDSGALAYLSCMDRHQREQPDIKPREAASLAACDLMVDWLVNNIAG